MAEIKESARRGGKTDETHRVAFTFASKKAHEHLQHFKVNKRSRQRVEDFFNETLSSGGLGDQYAISAEIVDDYTLVVYVRHGDRAGKNTLPEAKGTFEVAVVGDKSRFTWEPLPNSDKLTPPRTVGELTLAECYKGHHCLSWPRKKGTGPGSGVVFTTDELEDLKKLLGDDVKAQDIKDRLENVELTEQGEIVAGGLGSEN